MFEGLLAWRYIRTQKRHSALTIGSIAAALAMMAFLFTVFSTTAGCLRSLALLNGNYHYCLTGLAKEDAAAIAAENKDYASCLITEQEEAYRIELFYDQYMGDIYDDLDAYISGLAAQYTGDPMAYDCNTMLVDLDGITLQARANAAEIFSLFYILVIFLAVSLRLIIDTAFEVSSKERERQFGMLRSIGATPRQTAGILTAEGLFLSLLGVPLGTGAGIGLAYLAFRSVKGLPLTETYLIPKSIVEQLHFSVSPLFIGISMVTGLVWVLLSAYGTGMRAIRRSPMQALTARSDTVKKVRKAYLYGKLFGWKGSLASLNNHRQPKRYVVTILALTISMTLLAVFPGTMRALQSQTQKELSGYWDAADPEHTPDLEIQLQYREDTPGVTVPRAVCFAEPLHDLENSGYFTDIDFTVGNRGRIEASDPEQYVIINYLTEYAYDQLCEGEPPVPYQELAESGEFVVMTDQDDLVSDGACRLEITRKHDLTEAGYNALSPEEQAACDVMSWYGETLYQTEEVHTEGFTIAGRIQKEGVVMDHLVILYGTIDTYLQTAEALYGDTAVHCYASCKLKDLSQYWEVRDYLDNGRKHMISYTDLISLQKIIEGIFMVLRVGIQFLTGMLALIAAVNMINIISTGILDRKRELAALQSIGMTKRQLCGMTVLECLQYCLTSGVAALFLSEAILAGTEIFLYNVMEMPEVTGYISYTQPVVCIGLVMTAAFFVAAAASFLPLWQMRKEPLAEQLRAVD